MSFIDKLVEENPDNYQNIIKSRILSKHLDMKIKQYNSLMDAYDKLIQEQSLNSKPSGEWKGIGGTIKQISGSGKDYIWGVQKSDQIWKCKKPCDGSSSAAYWKQVGGSLTQIVGGETDVWGINKSGQIFKTKQDGTAPADKIWTLITGWASTIAQGGGYIWHGNGTNTYYCKEPCNDGKWKRASELTSNGVAVIIIQLSCSNKNVYGIDNNENAWWRPIDNSGLWKEFGNGKKMNLKFKSIDATSNQYVYGIVGESIYQTNMEGTQSWTLSPANTDMVSTISGDPNINGYIYMTKTNGSIFGYTPSINENTWVDLPDQNYRYSAVSSPWSSNKNWRYLGQGENIDDCKIKAVQDKDTVYSSVVYNTQKSTGPGTFGQTCYGGVKGGTTNPQFQSGGVIITSLAPNGSSRLGGEEGEKLLKQMKKIQKEINELVENSEKNTSELKKTSNSLKMTKKTTNTKLSNLLDKLNEDRIKINKLLSETDVTADGKKEISDYYQQHNFIIYSLWILLVIISIFLAYHIVTSSSENISPLSYIFVGVWILILFKYYYKQALAYGISTIDYISTLMVDPI
jgi:hypothetical protein